MIKISAVIITFNEEKNIERCLHSLQDIVDEIIVVDSYSTDETINICNKYNTKVFQKEWIGYSGQKNWANNQASMDVILSIDADEALSEELKSSILELKKHPFKGAYSVNRLVNYCGNWIHHTSWYPDTKVRLWKKDEAFWEGEIHETIAFNSPTKFTLLKGDLYHYTYYTIEEHISQQQKFSTLSAKSLFAKGKKAPFYKLIINPFFSYFKDIVIRSGYLDGASGFTIAKISAQSVFWKYQKLRKLWAEKKSN